MSFFGLIRLNFGFKKVICCLYHNDTVSILRIIINLLINRFNITQYFSNNSIYILPPKNYTFIKLFSCNMLHENSCCMQLNCMQYCCMQFCCIQQSCTVYATLLHATVAYNKVAPCIVGLILSERLSELLFRQIDNICNFNHKK